MRFRYRDGRVSVSSNDLGEDLVKRSGCSSSATWGTFYNSPVLSSVGTYASMWDTVSPGFRKKSSEGKTFFNPMIRAEMRIDQGSGNSGGLFQNKSSSCSVPDLYYPQYRFSFLGSNTYGLRLSGFKFVLDQTGGLLPPNVCCISDDARRSAEVEAATACLNERGRSQSNLWETLAELDKNSTMLTDLFNNINKGFGRIPVRSKRLLQMLEGAAGAYLLYRYGLKPFINDIAAVANGLLNQAEFRRQTSRGKVNLSGSSSYTRAGTLYGTYYWSGRVSYTDTISVRCMSLDEAYFSTMENIGLSLKGLLTLPWELLTNSFVLDWFLNLGDLIGAYTPSPGLQQLGSCTVVEWNQKANFVTTGYTPYSHLNMLTPPGTASCSYEFTHKYRTVGLASPGLVIKSDFRFDSWTRVGDALALSTNYVRSIWNAWTHRHTPTH